MFPLLIPMAIGAVGGAVMNRKNPLKGAAIGAGLGAGAGALAPGLLGAAGASGSAASAAAPAAAWADGAGAIVAPAAQSAAPSGITGLLSSANAAATKYKPLMDAAGIGMNVAGQVGGQEQPAPAAPAPQMPTGGAQTLVQLAQPGQGEPYNSAAARDARRSNRRGLLG